MSGRLAESFSIRSPAAWKVQTGRPEPPIHVTAAGKMRIVQTWLTGRTKRGWQALEGIEAIKEEFLATTLKNKGERLRGLYCINLPPPTRLKIIAGALNGKCRLNYCFKNGSFPAPTLPSFAWIIKRQFCKVLIGTFFLITLIITLSEQKLTPPSFWKYGNHHKVWRGIMSLTPCVEVHCSYLVTKFRIIRSNPFWENCV